MRKKATFLYFDITSLWYSKQNTKVCNGPLCGNLYNSLKVLLEYLGCLRPGLSLSRLGLTTLIREMKNDGGLQLELTCNIVAPNINVLDVEFNYILVIGGIVLLCSFNPVFTQNFLVAAQLIYTN
ncbi:hypothetical protein GQX74_011318 [Glossina fuscipes]|nr:hypothetical protein GQX74_011318 [Glossina fuscipes]